jgi:16S rRNA (cytosine967-C5)-methyltransferase
VASAARELSRHLRRIDALAKALGRAPADFSLKEDLAIVRYVVWRRFFTHATWARLQVEVGLPGPVRPRSIPDALLESLASLPLPEETFASEEDRLATLYSFPAWLSQKLFESVPKAQWEPLFKALNEEWPLVFRVRPPESVDSMQAALKARGVEVRLLQGTDGVVLEDENRAIFDAPEFKKGRLQVMDLGSQLIVQLCRPPRGFSGARVADVCAGAGGKTLYLADLVGPGGKVWASDASSKRLEEGRQRVRKAHLSQVEFTKKAPLKSADVVLIDAPCSGTGVLGREPDQKWRMKKEGLAALLSTQATLLESTAQSLQPGGAVVYATCSVLADENERQIERFLEKNPDFMLEDAQGYVPPRFVENGYLRLWPHRTESTGFFGARLTKRPH